MVEHLFETFSNRPVENNLLNRKNIYHSIIRGKNILPKTIDFCFFQILIRLYLYDPVHLPPGELVLHHFYIS